ncbi:MAG TPA: zinc ribbon domain-containing protein [Gemmatimonadales bacterium]|nr:zinc ribbon domain-containing protein [Gemmatimonadales bacterium]
MPIYEYLCQACDSGFELLVRSDTTIACPRCGGRKVERTMSLPARHGGASSSSQDFSPIGPPRGGGGCHGGGCGCH